MRIVPAAVRRRRRKSQSGKPLAAVEERKRSAVSEYWGQDAHPVMLCWRTPGKQCKAMNLPAEVEYVTDMSEIMKYGVMSFPALGCE